jgi:hypothetical protein
MPRTVMVSHGKSWGALRISAPCMVRYSGSSPWCINFALKKPTKNSEELATVRLFKYFSIWLRYLESCIKILSILKMKKPCD